MILFEVYDIFVSLCIYQIQRLNSLKTSPSYCGVNKSYKDFKVCCLKNVVFHLVTVRLLDCDEMNQTTFFKQQILMYILHVNFKVLPAGVDRRTYFTGDPEITVSPLYVFGQIGFPLSNIITIATLPQLFSIHMNLRQFRGNNLIQF